MKNREERENRSHLSFKWRVTKAGPGQKKKNVFDAAEKKELGAVSTSSLTFSLTTGLRINSGERAINVSRDVGVMRTLGTVVA